MTKTAQPKVLILAAPGINRTTVTKLAFELAGAQCDVVHINQLIGHEVSLDRYRIFCIPGGFSYGDHIQSGRILALELQHNRIIASQLMTHLKRGRYVIGICNGFQTLVQCGLLPFGKFQPLNENKVSLAHNIPHKFQSRWVHLISSQSECKFVKKGELLTLPIEHGEGRFLASTQVLKLLSDNHQIVFKYCSEFGESAKTYPDNPNGSSLNIAGICDPTGQILGMMPHPEDFVRPEHHPNWRRTKPNPDGLRFFQQLVKSASQL
jgi:phosphoribosylformylglycinamidine synthase subunit PurQ / glutaminase